MKATILLALYATLTSAVKMGPEGICGDLGVMKADPDNLPDNVDITDLRLCADHPMGRNRTVEGLTPVPVETTTSAVADTGLSGIEKRACYFGADKGCSNGYCWKMCGGSDGAWCWTAESSGTGPWRKCSKDSDCGTAGWGFGCGTNCKDKGVCGCSC